MASLATTVAGIQLECCIYNASGPRTGTMEALQKIAKSRSGAVLSKSATLVSQTGNPLPRYKEVELGEAGTGSINSEGLPNAGIDYYISKEVVEGVCSLGKPYIVSLSGLSLKDNLEMLDRTMKVKDITAIELNLACPNIPGKPTIAYDFEQMDSVLSEVTSHPAFASKPLGVKLAPYFDLPHMQKAAEIINKYPVRYVVSTNTIGNGLLVDVDNEQPLIKPKGGLGGLGGAWIKPTALANVRQMRLLLRSEIDIIGVGGIASGRDAFEFILCGASAVQVGTCHWSEGAVCFNRIAGELEALMVEKGYQSIAEFKGKLKEYSRPERKTDAKRASSHSSKVSKVGPVEGNLMLQVLMMILCTLLGVLIAHVYPSTRIG